MILLPKRVVFRTPCQVDLIMVVIVVERIIMAMAQILAKGVIGKAVAFPSGLWLVLCHAASFASPLARLHFARAAAIA